MPGTEKTTRQRIPIGSKFGSPSHTSRPLPSLGKSVFPGATQPSFARADAARIRGTGRRWRNSSESHAARKLNVPDTRRDEWLTKILLALWRQNLGTLSAH